MSLDDYMTDEKEKSQTSTKKRWETHDTDLQDEFKKAEVPPNKDPNDFEK
jgi:hypothetical protein